MGNFSDVVDAADNLSVDEQEALVEILRRRIAERRHADLLRDVADAREEFNAGRCRAVSVDDIMNEVREEA